MVSEPLSDERRRLFLSANAGYGHGKCKHDVATNVAYALKSK